jgi:phospholipid transport system substrate-binding protein
MLARVFIVVLALLSVLPPLPARAADNPRAVVERLSQTLLEIMKRGRELGFQGRVERLKPVVASAYDMVAMTKGTLGVAANKLSTEDTDRLAEAYTRFSVATYADQFDSWGGERFEVGEPRSSANGMVVVPSQIIPGSGSPTRVDYLMHEDAGRWTIIDVLFDGSVSQVAVRRSEFVSIFRKDGLPGLITLLDDKSASLGKK